MRQYGGVVFIINNEIVTLWGGDFDYSSDENEELRGGIEALDAYIMSKEVTRLAYVDDVIWDLHVLLYI